MRKGVKYSLLSAAGAALFALGAAADRYVFNRPDVVAHNEIGSVEYRFNGDYISRACEPESKLRIEAKTEDIFSDLAWHHDPTRLRLSDLLYEDYVKRRLLLYSLPVLEIKESPDPTTAPQNPRRLSPYD